MAKQTAQNPTTAGNTGKESKMLQQVNIDKYGTKTTRDRAIQVGEDPTDQLQVMLPQTPDDPKDIAKMLFGDVAMAFAEAYGWDEIGGFAAAAKLWNTCIKHLKDRLRARAKVGTSGIPADIKAALKTADPATLAALRAILDGGVAVPTALQAEMVAGGVATVTAVADAITDAATTQQ